MRDLYREATNQILAEIEAGAQPWARPWSQTPGFNVPWNAVTGRPYSGVNTLLLWTARSQGWSQPRFLTFKQAREAGGHVRKGEHGRHVVFVRDFVKRPDAESSEEPDVIRMLKSYVVFNVSQCEELPDRITSPPKGPNPDQRDFLVDEFIREVGAQITEDRLVDEAFYSRDTDQIVVPAFGSFKGRSHDGRAPGARAHRCVVETTPPTVPLDHP